MAVEVCWIFAIEDIPEQSWRNTTVIEIMCCQTSYNKEDLRRGDVVI